MIKRKKTLIGLLQIQHGKDYGFYQGVVGPFLAAEKPHSVQE
jgi:hypothetical protein